MESGGEGKLRILHHADRGKWMNSAGEQLRIPQLYSRCKNQGKHEHLRIPVYANSEENIINNRD